MSTTPREGTPIVEPGARAPSRASANGFLRWLDGFLSEPLRQAPLAELGRSRVLVGTTLALIFISVLILTGFATARAPGGYIVGGSSVIIGYSGVLWLLRRTSSTRPSALLLCAIMSSGVALTALSQNDSYLSTNSVGMMVTVLSVYLLGPRLGLIILVPMALSLGVGHPLWLHLAGIGPRVPTEGHLWVMHGMAALSMLSGWAVGWLYSSAHEATHAALERDIQARKDAEAKLGALHRTLLDVSRQAGMTEIATGVLHNVGNTLNSLNVSVGLVMDQLRGSRVPKLVQATELVNQHEANLPAFLTTDPRGTKLPAYLSALATQLSAERESLLKEMQSLNESVDHIKSIVSMQQRHARYGGLLEQVPVPQLINDALRLDADSFERLGIEVRHEYGEVPPILVDRHKLLQILLNLLSNARHALVESATPDKRLTIRVGLGAGGARLRIEVEDNGVGIPPENLTRLFSQGFTTKKKGHGFGLHISALAAQELNGRLSVTSPGPCQGATFTIELPLDTAFEKPIVS